MYKYDEEVLGKSTGKSFAKKDNSRPDHTSIPYTVKKGDTLYSISRKFNLSVEELKEINNLRSNDLAIGQKLYVEAL
ncbi:LysM peptidoglycan-binding domain-containing protein [Mesonia maritima]|uniref:LysM peptidoglycan-binding domain-containing protein n=1 Tax=Mesonia maritima TaxID=1793873 RepID=UPI003641C81D